uniref:myoferlin-like n=1 Tax=Myxine glutinosa TaxID=7769 RepID=UPI00358FF7E6
MEILNEKEFEEKPAGQGRDDPNVNPTLEPPIRPKTSFLWFTSPFKSFKYILCKRYQKYICFGVFTVLVTLFLSIFLYSLPNYSAQKILDLI